MRLADVLSKSPTQDFDQVEGFIGLKNLTTGNQRKITAGKVALNYFCENCKEIRTFLSREELYLIFSPSSPLCFPSPYFPSLDFFHFNPINCV